MRNLFIELLQVSLGTRSKLSKVPTEIEWDAIRYEAQRQSMLAFLVEGLNRLSFNQRPHQAQLLQWIGLAQMIEAVYALHCERAKEITKLCNENSNESTVLKGVGVSQYYPVPSHRQCGDIDLWVAGDRKTIMEWLSAKYPVDHIVWHHVDAKIFDDVSIEIHFHPGWLYNPFCNRRLQCWFEKQKIEQMVVDEKLGFAYPTARFNAVYSLVHLYHHLIEEGIGIRHTVDCYYILKALPVDERSHVLANLKSFGMYKVTAALMWVLKEVCGISSEYLLCEPDEKEGRFVLDEVMNGGNFGQYRKDSRRRNTVSRMLSLLPHYPKEVLWVVPWKLWHKCWRHINA